MRSKLKLGNIALLLALSAFALLLCELIARLVLNPVDYVSPVLVRDEILGIRLPGKSGGDNWGFRNAKVPETAEIVAWGDSHTYTVKMNEAWPKVLGAINGKNVYNLAMRGYGPNQFSRMCGAGTWEIRGKKTESIQTSYPALLN